MSSSWDSGLLPLDLNEDSYYLLVLRPLDSGLEFYHGLSWDLSLPTTDCGISQPPQSYELISYNNSYIYNIIFNNT